MSFKTVIIITGPTASGKTDLAIEVARYFDTQIISADSRQCFRELNIGVAKPTPEQLSAVSHLFINSHSIHDEVNAAVFEALAIQWCDEIFVQKDVVIICGGTGLYINAFRDGLDEIPIIQEGIRKNIITNYNESGIGWLQESVRREDPQFFSSGETSNPQRLMRALEVMQSTGRSILSFRNQQKKQRDFRILEFGIQVSRKELYSRIDARVDRMMESGLLDEVYSLLSVQHLNALHTVGYSELFDYFNGKLSLKDAVERMKRNTRHYAKRQMTWFNKSENLLWMEADFLNRILAAYGSVKT